MPCSLLDFQCGRSVILFLLLLVLAKECSLAHLAGLAPNNSFNFQRLHAASEHLSLAMLLAKSCFALTEELCLSRTVLAFGGFYTGSIQKCLECFSFL